MQIDVSFLPVYAAVFMLSFARIGTMVMLLPGLGEMTVSPRVRLTIAPVLTAFNCSYLLFKPGDIPLFGDVASILTNTVSGTFRIGVQLSAPFLVFGLLFNLGLGILSRLMPQMQVFFIGMPLSILVGFLILLL